MAGETFQPKSALRRDGWICILFSLVPLVGSLILMFGVKPGEHGFPDWRAIIGIGGTGIFIGIFFLGSGIWILLAAKREELRISDARINVRNLFSERFLPIAAIDHLYWRPLPGGRIVLRGAEQKISIELAKYELPDRLRIIEYFYRAVPADRQEGWPMFCHLIALRLRDGVSPAERRLEVVGRTKPASFALVTRRSYDKAGILMVLVAAIGAMVVWQQYDFPLAFLFPTTLFCVYLTMRFMTPRAGKKDIRIDDTSGFARILFAAFAGLAALVLMDFSTVFVVLYAVLLPANIMLAAHRVDQKVREGNLLAAEVAVETWRRGEPVQEVTA